MLGGIIRVVTKNIKRIFRKRRAVGKIALLHLRGVITDSRSTQGAVLNFRQLRPLLEQLYSKKSRQQLKAVFLLINCPGGAPGQSELIAGYLRQLADQHKIPLYAFVEDVAASGGYWLACAADKIYALNNSVVGSIGVVSASFGFTEAMQKLGVERRIYAQGEHKVVLDPFSPTNPKQLEILEQIQQDVYHEFMQYVRVRREGKLKADGKLLFSGAFWTGQVAKAYGLVDDIGSMVEVAKREFGDKIEFIELPKVKWSLFSMLKGSQAINSTHSLSAEGLVQAVRSVVVEETVWKRYGL